MILIRSWIIFSSALPFSGKIMDMKYIPKREQTANATKSKLIETSIGKSGLFHELVRKSKITRDSETENTKVIQLFINIHLISLQKNSKFSFLDCQLMIVTLNLLKFSFNSIGIV